MFFRRERLPAAAKRLVLEHERLAPAELVDVLISCGDQLQPQFPKTGREEIDAVLLATWAAVAGEKTTCTVDLAASTPHLIWLVDPVAGTRRPIPVVDLVRILGPRAAA